MNTFTADDVSVFRPTEEDVLVFTGGNPSGIGDALQGGGVKFKLILFLKPGETLAKLTDDQLDAAGLQRKP